MKIYTKIRTQTTSFFSPPRFLIKFKYNKIGSKVYLIYQNRKNKSEPYLDLK